MLAYLHLRCKLSISKHKTTFVCLLALLPLFATQGKQALARDRSKQEIEGKIRRQLMLAYEYKQA
jgi:hypothetical protein